MPRVGALQASGRSILEEALGVSVDGPKGYDNCGWAKAASYYCFRKKRALFESECPCRYWIRRLRIDRLKGKRKR